MELRRSVSLSSTWEARGDMQAVLHITSSSGALQDEPQAAESATTPPPSPPPSPLLLLQIPSPGQPCLLRLDLSRLQGYTVSHLELTSTARTTELYQNGEEYVGTVRGSVVTSSEHCSQEKVYCCHHSLPSNVLQELSIKLLSLRGRGQVLIHKVQLVVSEDVEGVSTDPRRPVSGGLDMQQLLNDLSVHNMPPFFHTLVSSLQRATSQSEELAPPGEMSAELSQLVESFKQLRPAPPVNQTEAPTHHQDGRGEAEGEGGGEGEEGGGGESERAVVRGGEGGGEEADLVVVLEAKLKCYIDKKFEDLERKLERQIQELLITSKLQAATVPCTGELVHDQQLD